jgi:hypothetical protein
LPKQGSSRRRHHRYQPASWARFFARRYSLVEANLADMYLGGKGVPKDHSAFFDVAGFFTCAIQKPC